MLNKYWTLLLFASLVVAFTFAGKGTMMLPLAIAQSMGYAVLAFMAIYLMLAIIECASGIDMGVVKARQE